MSSLVQTIQNKDLLLITKYKSFYASCIAVLHDLDVRTVPIAVVGNLEQKGSGVLAASPPMKKRFRVKTGTRLFEIPNHPDMAICYSFISKEKVVTYVNKIDMLLDIYVDPTFKQIVQLEFNKYSKCNINK